MICEGGPMNGLKLHSSRDQFHLVLANGYYQRGKHSWTWVQQ